jgi:nucleotide-binding universal stress UspA family protein
VSERLQEVLSVAKRILVPVDRTASEAVLPLIAGIAREAGATVRLLYVEPVPGEVVSSDGRVLADADQHMDRIEASRLNELEGFEASLQNVPVERVVRFGDPAREILIEAEAWEADLIAMTAPPGSWFTPIRRGSVAAQVLRKADLPVVVYRHRRGQVELQQPR